MTEENDDKPIRINLLIDKELNPKLYAYLKTINKRKRAGIIKRLSEENLKK